MDISTTQQFEPSERIQLGFNRIRQYVEQQIPAVDIKKYPERPSKHIALTIGDPTVYQNFQNDPKWVDELKKNVGKFDGYSDFNGMQKNREILCQLYSTPRYQLELDDVYITQGGSLSIWLSVLALCDAGDNFLCPAPTFPLIITIAEQMGIVIKYFNLYEHLDWECKLEELEDLVDERTKFLYMVDPSNPLGTVFNKQHKIDIIKFCEKHNNLPIVADETYQHLVYNGPSFVHFHELSETVPIFYICSFSKKWLSPGWRCGWLILFGQKGVFTEIKKGIQNLLKITLMSNTIVQSAMPALLQAEETFINQKMHNLNDSFNFLKELLKDVKAIKMSNSRGAFYASLALDYNYLSKEIDTSKKFALQFFAEQNAAVMPGELFYGKDFVRIIMCADQTELRDFAERLIAFCNKYKN